MRDRRAVDTMRGIEDGLAAAARDAAMEVPINVRRFMGGILLLPGGKGTEIR